MDDIESAAQQALAERCELWKALARHLDKLLACYRTGKQPSGGLLDHIRWLRDQLADEEQPC